MKYAVIALLVMSLTACGGAPGGPKASGGVTLETTSVDFDPALDNTPVVPTGVDTSHFSNAHTGGSCISYPYVGNWLADPIYGHAFHEELTMTEDCHYISYRCAYTADIENQSAYNNMHQYPFITVPFGAYPAGCIQKFRNNCDTRTYHNVQANRDEMRVACVGVPAITYIKQ